MEVRRATGKKEIFLRDTECQIQPLRRKHHCQRKNYRPKDHRAHSSSCPRNSIDTCKAKIYTSQQGWKYSTDAIEFREDAETEDEPQSEPDNMPTNNTVQREDYTLPRLLPEKLAMHLCWHICRGRIWKNQEEPQRLQRRVTRKHKKNSLLFY